MRPEVDRTLSGGLLGTVTITIAMYWVAPLVLGSAMDVASMLAGFFGVSWGAGMLIHFVDGALIFPLVYREVYRVLPGASWVRGALWGTLLWLLAETVVMPVMGAGLFHASAGGALAAAASLLGHLLYGATLGAVANGPATFEAPAPPPERRGDPGAGLPRFAPSPRR